MARENRSRSRTKLLVAVLLAALVVGWIYRSALPNMFARRALADRDTAAALGWLTIGRRISSQNAQTQFLLSRAYRRIGRMQLARDHLDAAERLGWPRESVERETWLALAQAGWLAEAGPHLADLLTDPRGDHAEICEAFVIGYIKMHDVDAARKLLAAWQHDLPGDPQPHFLLGMTYQDYDWKSAIDHYQRALKIDPSHEQAAFALAECLLTGKRPAEALPYYELAEKTSDDKPRAWTGQAHCLRLLGQPEEALLLLERALAENTDHAAAGLEWSQMKLEAGNFDQAARQLEPLAKQEPRNWKVQFAYATALRGIGKIGQAKKLFDRISHARSQLRKAGNLAEQLKQDDVATRYEIGKAHMDYGEPAEGLWWLRSVLSYDPSHAAAHSALADYYAAKESEDPRYAKLAQQHRRLAEDRDDQEIGPQAHSKDER
ncbi:MAG: tetratricopeptide repeat protein [Pirellulaceae bacterium]